MRLSGQGLPLQTRATHDTILRSAISAPVAQLDRVQASEACGRWFESTRARHEKTQAPTRGFFMTGSGQVCHLPLLMVDQSG